MTTVAADDEMMDFSSSRRSIPFKVDDDVFEAVADIAAELALDYADYVEKLETRDTSAQEQKEVLHALLRLILLPESAERFIARLSDPHCPIGQGKIVKITRWLFEEYGLRPTESDSASSTGSENRDAGTSSTVST